MFMSIIYIFTQTKICNCKTLINNKKFYVLIWFSSYPQYNIPIFKKSISAKFDYIKAFDCIKKTSLSTRRRCIAGN